MITTFDQKLAELLNGWQVEGWPVGNLILVLTAILLSVVLCGIIGIEREWRGRSAGLRTHLLVGVGSCVIMILSIYGFPGAQQVADHRDVARLAAGVLAGVGFLGAGAIIHDHGSIKGLTTAGTIWLVMAIGLACGSFNFIIAVIVTLVVMVVLTIFRKLERKVNKNSPFFLLTCATDVPVMSLLLNYAKEHRFIMSDVSTELLDGHLQIIFKFTSENNADVDVSKLEDELKTLTKAITVQALNRH